MPAALILVAAVCVGPAAVGLWVSARHRFYVHFAVIVILIAVTGLALHWNLSLSPNLMYPEGMTEEMKRQGLLSVLALTAGFLLTPLAGVVAVARMCARQRRELRELYGDVPE